MKNILPSWLYENIASNYLLDYISEIRIRQNKPIIICYQGRYEIAIEKFKEWQQKHLEE